jgi:hypothetical protein
MEDFRDIKKLTLDEFIRRARSGTSVSGHRCGLVDAQQWRAFYVESAEEIMRTVVDENRALSSDEDRAMGRLMDGASEIGLVIDELRERHRKDLAGGLIPLNHPPYAR